MRCVTVNAVCSHFLPTRAHCCEESHRSVHKDDRLEVICKVRLRDQFLLFMLTISLSFILATATTGPHPEIYLKSNIDIICAFHRGKAPHTAISYCRIIE